MNLEGGLGLVRAPGKNVLDSTALLEVVARSSWADGPMQDGHLEQMLGLGKTVFFPWRQYRPSSPPPVRLRFLWAAEWASKWGCRTLKERPYGVLVPKADFDCCGPGCSMDPVGSNGLPRLSEFGRGSLNVVPL